MYSDGNGGCLKNSSTGLDIPVTTRQLAQVRGIPNAHLDLKIEEARQNIERILALNNYREWLAGTAMDSTPEIDLIVKEYPDLLVTNFTGGLLVASCSSKNWSKWLLTLESPSIGQTWTRRTLLGITAHHYKIVRARIEQTIVGRTKDSTVRQKRANLSRDTKLKELPKWEILPQLHPST